MARPRKDAVDYFPHFVNWGKTIPILESKFGNDGYACWFKILETLGKTSGHALDCNDSMEWEFLVQKLRVSEETATEIIAVLCKLGALDATLWNEKRIIWSENFVAQLEPVYSKRRVSAPEKPECGGFCDENPDAPEVSGAEKRQRRVEKSRVKKSREKQYTPEFEKFWEFYPRKEGKGRAAEVWNRDGLDAQNGRIVESIKSYLPIYAKREEKYIPLPGTWLNEKRYDDTPGVKRGSRFEEVL